VVVDTGPGIKGLQGSRVGVGPALIVGIHMTLEEGLAIAREIAARTKPRFVVDNSREEMRQARFAKAKRLTERLARRLSPRKVR
jgi:hypothetical protein